MPRGSISIGPLSPVKGTGSHFKMPAQNFPPTQYVCNAGQPNLTQEQAAKLMPKAPARPGADQHKQYRSKGNGC